MTCSGFSDRHVASRHTPGASPAGEHSCGFGPQTGVSSHPIQSAELRKLGVLAEQLLSDLGDSLESRLRSCRNRWPAEGPGACAAASFSAVA